MMRNKNQIKHCPFVPFVGAYTCICNCGESFLNPGALNAHLKNGHTTIKQEKDAEIKEEKINYTYENEYISTEDSKDDVKIPIDCKKVVFKLTDQLIILDKENSEHDYNQILPKEEVIAEFYCNVCGRSCDTEESLEAHKIHKHKQPISRPRVKTDPDASKPKKKKIQKITECEVCGKMLKSCAMRLYHRRMHNGEKPFACTLCSKAFITKPLLTDHIRTHTGERPFKCHLCPKTYNKRTSLGRHLVAHSGIKRYSCPDCGKAFSQSDLVTQHRKIVHLKTYKYRSRAKKPTIDKKVPVRVQEEMRSEPSYSDTDSESQDSDTVSELVWR